MIAKAEIIDVDGLQVEFVGTDRRKTIAVTVQNGRVQVRAPQGTPIARVVDLVTRKTLWIRKKMLLQQQRRPQLVRRYTTGGRFVYLDDEVLLQVVAGAKKRVILNNNQLVVRVPDRVTDRDQYVRRAIHEWYGACALAHLTARVADFAGSAGVAPSSIKVRHYKARWGSCSRNGELAFNWLIMVAPPAIVDYVVVHELCHLVHHHHQAAFWEQVRQKMPDYQQQRRWLRENGWQLVV